MALDLESSEALQDTLQFVASSSIESRHKRVLMDVLLRALRDIEEEKLAEASRPKAPEWQPHEELTVSEYLRDKTAKSWQHADELTMRLAAQLHRAPADVREKAIAMGAGAAVDYRLAKARAAT
jgi:hypothetical protein